MLLLMYDLSFIVLTCLVVILLLLVEVFILHIIQEHLLWLLLLRSALLDPTHLDFILRPLTSSQALAAHGPSLVLDHDRYLQYKLQKVDAVFGAAIHDLLSLDVAQIVLEDLLSQKVN